jgi:LytR cell envelope-related transcriptional attenuator
VDHAEQLPRPFPWRAATLVAAAVATVELVALIVAGAFLLARPLHHPARAAVAPAAKAAQPAVRTHRAAAARVRLPAHALRARANLSVLVLNGNGVQGAAAREAATLHGLGYRIGNATNAQRHDYARSMVMYVPPFAPEARRLAHDTGIRLVAPIDGLKPRALKGAKLVVLLGS